MSIGFIDETQDNTIDVSRRIEVNAEALKSLLRQVDPAGFWSRDLRIGFVDGKILGVDEIRSQYTESV